MYHCFSVICFNHQPFCVTQDKRTLCVCECVYVCVCVCVISNQSTSKNHMSDLGKLDTMLHKTHIKVLDMCRSIISLSKMANQMWSDLPLS